MRMLFAFIISFIAIYLFIAPQDTARTIGQTYRAFVDAAMGPKCPAVVHHQPTCERK